MRVILLIFPLCNQVRRRKDAADTERGIRYIGKLILYHLQEQYRALHTGEILE
jgi:hypothetical protein